MSDIKQEELTELYKEYCSLVGLENTLLIYDVFKGQQITFPIHLVSREFIRAQMLSEYNGRNIKAISKKYGDIDLF